MANLLRYIVRADPVLGVRVTGRRWWAVVVLADPIWQKWSYVTYPIDFEGSPKWEPSNAKGRINYNYQWKGKRGDDDCCGMPA